MPKLNDTQLMLLAHAAKHDGGNYYPLPETLAGTARATKAIAALTKLSMAEERETTDCAAVSRTDDDQRYGTFITAAGLAAIGVGEAGEGGVVQPSTPAPAPSAPKPVSKTDGVLGLLRREQGATLSELIEATGWLPHTTRAALTGLRKKGHAIARGKRGDATCYTLPAAAVA